MRTIIPLLFIVITSHLHPDDVNPKPFLVDTLAPHASVRDWTVRGDGQEAYFSSQSLYGEISVIMRLTRIDGGWSDPQPVTFTGPGNDLEPFLSPDGLRLYFASDRPVGDAESDRHFDIWYVEREGVEKAWSEPANIGAPVNTPGNEFYPAVTRERSLFFTSDREGSKRKDDIFLSMYREDKYTNPESLPTSVNSTGYEFNAYVAPDGAFIIFTAYNREDGSGSGDLYISEKDGAGKWSPARNLGAEINSSRMDYCPFVDAAGNLTFTSKRIDFPDPPYHVESAEDWMRITGKPENGQSHLYIVPGFFEKL